MVAVAVVAALVERGLWTDGSWDSDCLRDMAGWQSWQVRQAKLFFKELF